VHISSSDLQFFFVPQITLDVAWWLILSYKDLKQKSKKKNLLVSLYEEILNGLLSAIQVDEIVINFPIIGFFPIFLNWI
jgi:hypothetical protein